MTPMPKTTHPIYWKLLRLCSWLVPQELRQDWLEDWQTETGLRLERGPQVGALSLLAGAFSHALWLRLNPWRPRIVFEDFKHGFRQLTRNLGFTLAAGAVLALGIGATTTVFTFFNGLLLRTLPAVTDPDRLVNLWRTQDGQGADSVSYPVFLYYRENNDVLEDLAAFAERTFPVIQDQALLLLEGQLVTPNYLRVLGVEPLLGSDFTDSQLSEPVVLLSYRLWEDQFGGSPSVLGKTLSIRGKTLRIQGVLPPGFRGTDRLSAPDLWIPVGLEDQLAPSRFGVRLQLPDMSWLQMLGRLRPAVGIEPARKSLEVLAANLRELYPQNGKAGIILDACSGLNPEAHRQARLVSGLLMGLVGLLLLISCANVSGLILARNSVRQQEMGVRQALGAGRLRVIRQLLAECVILGLLASAASIVFAFWSGRLLVDLFSRFYQTSFSMDPSPNLTVLGFSLLLGLCSVMISGLGPAMAASGSNLVDSLRPGGGRLTANRRWRTWLVVGQIAVCLLVLTGGGLFLRTIQQIQTVDPGFRDEGVIVYPLFPGFLGLSEERGRIFYQQLEAGLRNWGPVQSRALSSSIPLVGTHSAVGIPGEDFPHLGRPYLIAEHTVVSPGYFHSLSIPLLRGRDFLESEDSSGGRSTVIVSRVLADMLWPGEDPLGKTLNAGTEKSLQVVGVAADVKYRDLREPPRPALYRPLSQDYRGSLFLLVNAAGSQRAIDLRVRETVSGLLPQHPLEGLPLSQRIEGSFGEQRLLARLSAIFAVAALGLTSVGLYGITAFSVSRRRKEIGIRSALGAPRGRLLAQVLGEGIRLSLTGALLGTGLLAMATRLVNLGGLLYQVGPLDPWSLLGSATLLLSITLLACLAPARRAARTDPIRALRCD